MAKCERCGATFDYEERQGVCPKCCFYNRKPGAVQQDTEWMKHYNIEDNSYQLPKSEGLEELFPEKHSRWSKKKHINRREKEMSEKSRRKSTGHRLSDSRRDRWKGDGADRSYGRAERDSRAPIIGKVVAFCMVVCIVLIAVTVLLRIADTRGWNFGQGENTEEYKMMQVKKITAEEAASGINVGNLTYYVGEAKTLFQEGELSDLPAGEKCIGIWMENNQSTLDYDGYDWEKPYVFDGTNFREMVDADALDDGYRFTEEGIETASVYGAGYKDMYGYGIFFVDADTQSVILSLPCQVVDPDHTDVAAYSEVIDISISLNQ